MNFHGNSRQSTKEHHLYAIHDKEEADVFKYGISDKPIGEDGSIEIAAETGGGQQKTEES